MVGDPQTLCSLTPRCFQSYAPPRQLSQRALGLFCGAAWVRWGSFSQRLRREVAPAGVRHQRGAHLSYELTPAKTSPRRLLLTEESSSPRRLWGRGGSEEALLGELAYRSAKGCEGGPGRGGHPSVGILLWASFLVKEPSERRRGLRQRVEMAISTLTRRGCSAWAIGWRPRS
jgi:hypothetical protein